MKTATLSRRYRLAVASRALAAIFGGYGLAAAFCVCLALTLPLDKSEAAIAGGVLGFIVYCAAVIWVFAARSALRAWAGVLLPALALAAVAWLAKSGGAA